VFPGVPITPSFGSPAVRLVGLTRGFASPPRGGFALFEKGSSLEKGVCARGVPDSGRVGPGPSKSGNCGTQAGGQGPIDDVDTIPRATCIVTSDSLRAILGVFARKIISLPAGRLDLGSPAMTAKERFVAFLVAHQRRSFCDECLARALGIDPSTAYRAAVKAGRMDGFIREYGVCSECGESRLVTRSSR